MDISKKIAEIQNELLLREMDGWMLYDFRYNNPLMHKVLEIPKNQMMSRRFFYWIPKQGEPIKIVAAIESTVLDHLPGMKWEYQSWQELEKFLFTISFENRKIAMEYSPYNALPVISKVDAGTVDLIRKSGAEVVSSANLLQRYTSVWTKQQLVSHLYAAEVLNEVVALTWSYIENALTNQQVLDEYTVQQFMVKEIADRGCTAYQPPICAVNANSANPHYTPQKEKSSVITRGDFILLDLWCKKQEPFAVYADITRVGVADNQPTEKQEQVFLLVKKARDKATEFIQLRYEQQLPIQAWEVDQVCRNIISEAGFGDQFLHRTGHNIGEDLHGEGANLDNFETHDFRLLIPGTCFSVEPGIYLKGEFGVRMEYDIYLEPSTIKITGGIQENLVCMSF